MPLPPKIPSLPLMASPDGNQQQQTWVPYEAAKDCSQGFCSIYCPQWCYIIFPPPPPFSFVDDSSSSGTSFSPLVIAIIGILASAFLLVSYYTIISKYCGGFRRRRRRRGDPLGPDEPAADDDDGDGGDQSQRHETWQVSASNGLDEALISKISVYKYRGGEGLVDGTDCSVCLGEFREDESLRLLPKCSHAFHVQCIDTWLRSHSNCPLCRANIVSVGPPPPPPPPPQLPGPPLPSSETSHVEAEGGRNEEAVVVIDDLEEETSSLSDADGSKENSEDHGDSHHDIIEIRDGEGIQHLRRSFSMDSSHRGRVSIADILQQSMEDEFMVAKDQGLLTGSGSSSRGGGESNKGGGRSRSLHCVMSPVPMKRSVSSGRFSLNRQGKGRNSSVLPI